MPPPLTIEEVIGLAFPNWDDIQVRDYANMRRDSLQEVIDSYRDGFYTKVQAEELFLTMFHNDTRPKLAPRSDQIDIPT